VSKRGSKCLDINVVCGSTHNLLIPIDVLKLLGSLQCTIRTVVVNHNDLIVVATAMCVWCSATNWLEHPAVV